MSTSITATTDVVNSILGIDDSSPLAALRNQKPDLVREVQEYYQSLFAPTDASAANLPLVDRYIVAVRVASHTRSTAVATWFADLARAAGADEALLARLSQASDEWQGDGRLDAAIQHADLLVTAPSDAQPADLETLKQAGFNPGGIVALSQTIAFVTYLVRLVAGLRAIGQGTGN
jgi:CMD domain protein